MSRFGRPALVAFILLAAPAVAFAASGAPGLSGTWQRLPAAPITVDYGPTSVWTGKQLIVYGRRGASEVAAAYDPAARSWTRLVIPNERPPAWSDGATWTGKEMLLWSPFGAKAFNPATKSWRHLKGSLPGGNRGR